MCTICPRLKSATPQHNEEHDNVNPHHKQSKCQYLRKRSNEFNKLCYGDLLPRSVHPEGCITASGDTCPSFLAKYLHYFCLEAFFFLHEASKSSHTRWIADGHFVPSAFFELPPHRLWFRTWSEWLVRLRDGTPFSNASLFFYHAFLRNPPGRNETPLVPPLPYLHDNLVYGLPRFQKKKKQELDRIREALGLI